MTKTNVNQKLYGRDRGCVLFLDENTGESKIIPVSEIKIEKCQERGLKEIGLCKLLLQDPDNPHLCTVAGRYYTEYGANATVEFFKNKIKGEILIFDVSAFEIGCDLHTRYPINK